MNLDRLGRPINVGDYVIISHMINTGNKELVIAVVRSILNNDAITISNKDADKRINNRIRKLNNDVVVITQQRQLNIEEYPENQL
jgi:hypothetical protein